jgi:hypothetical protein
MTNIINNESLEMRHQESSTHVVESGYFRERMHHFEDQYRAAYPRGWGEFFADYSNGKTDEENLDYDEWAFLCEHFMRELTGSSQPPGDCGESQERPERFSGLSFLGDTICSIQISISQTSNARLTDLSVGREQSAQNQI